jgi:hypothetical protein
MDQLSGFYFSMEPLAANLEATAVTRIACSSVAPLRGGCGGPCAEDAGAVDAQ